MTSLLAISKTDSIVKVEVVDSTSAKYKWILDDKICSDSVYVLVNVSLPKGKREPIQVGREGVLMNFEIKENKWDKKWGRTVIKKR